MGMWGCAPCVVCHLDKAGQSSWEQYQRRMPPRYITGWAGRRAGEVLKAVPCTGKFALMHPKHAVVHGCQLTCVSQALAERG